MDYNCHLKKPGTMFNRPSFDEQATGPSLALSGWSVAPWIHRREKRDKLALHNSSSRRRVLQATVSEYRISHTLKGARIGDFATETLEGLAPMLPKAG